MCFCVAANRVGIGLTGWVCFEGDDREAVHVCKRLKRSESKRDNDISNTLGVHFGLFVFFRSGLPRKVRNTRCPGKLNPDDGISDAFRRLS